MRGTWVFSWAIGLAAAGLGLAGNAAASETRTFVAKWVYVANYSQDSDCPQGLNPPADGIFRRILHERGMAGGEIEKELGDFPYSMYRANIGMRGRVDGKPANVYVNPTSVPDPMLKLGVGHVGLGFNLDGRDSKSDFVDPESHEHGVDNQLARVTTCTISLRAAPGHHPPLPEIQWDLTREHNPAWLVEISGIDDPRNDDDVTVRFMPAKGGIRRDAKGDPQFDITYVPDHTPRTAGNAFHARIRDGLLVTDVHDFFMPGDPFVQADYTFKQARVRFTLNDDGTARGYLGGYQDWRRLWVSWALAGVVYEVNNSLDIPGLYYALRKTADAYPDPRTGQNTHISSTYMIDLIPAFFGKEAAHDIVKTAATPSRARFDAPLATPPGITLRNVRIGQGVGVPGQSSVTPPLRLVLSDSAFRTVYTYGKDEPGKSNCVDACSAAWPPVVVEQGIVPPKQLAPEWSVITRADGRKQWAFRGAPLYTYSKDNDGAADAMGGGLEPLGQGIDNQWRIVELMPDRWMKLPDGILVDELPSAAGQALVNTKHQPLYVFDAGTGAAKPPSADWKPVLAPRMALPFGEFAVLGGNGLSQWAWHGNPLFTYSGDVDMGDANGSAADQRFDVALVMRYFMPEKVVILRDQRRGGVLAAEESGHALYARDRAYANLQGGFNTRGANRGSIATGRSIGASGCDQDCERTRRPLKAPDDARNWGYWSVLTRADGTKQWAYQGYPLYSFDREEPGQVSGDAVFDLTINDGLGERSVANLGLYWRAATP